MRLLAICLTVFLAVLVAGCKNNSGIAGFWDDLDVTITEANYQSSQDRFAGFAELLLDASADEAEAAVDALFDKLTGNEVDYIIYSQWMESAFHNYFSPCRNYEIFDDFVARVARDGILSDEEVERLENLATQDKFNIPGEPCLLPGGIEPQGNTLYLVLNLDCRTCLQWLEGLAGTHPETAHVALCFGYSRIPEVSGWTYLKPDGMDKVFELEAAPFWFLTAADGTIDTPYSIDVQVPEYANPQAL